MDSLFRLQQPGLSKFVSASLIIHIVILAVALLLVQGKQGRVFITPTYTKVNLIAPQATKKKAPAKAVKPAKAKKKVAIKKAKPVVKKTEPVVKKKAIALKKAKTPPPVAKPVEVEQKVSIDDALSKLEKKVAEEEEDLMVAAMIERLAKKTEAEERKKKELLEELRAEIAEYETANNSVDAQSSANAFEGLSSEIFDLKFKSYYNKVGAKIQSLWIYSGDAHKELQTLITIKINKNGALLDYWVEKKSGDHKFDDSALRAVEKAAPFPVLPEDYNEEDIEIGLRFCPGGCVENN
ncbi:MAG: TonB family protein [Proteobacteria bacterium]|nr:TonB family protein [Pseudomonadota bacterium]